MKICLCLATRELLNNSFAIPVAIHRGQHNISFGGSEKSIITKIAEDS